MGDRTSLADVHKCLLLAKYQFRAFGPTEVWVVNYSTPHPSPRRFTYSACQARTETGRKCLKSTELGRTCKHRDATKPAFRFKVVLVDCYHGGVRPLTVNLWHAAAELLRCDAISFSTRPEVHQASYLQDLMESTPRVLVNLKIQDGEVHVQCLSWSEECVVPLPPGFGLLAHTPEASSSNHCAVEEPRTVPKSMKKCVGGDALGADLKYIVKGLTKIFQQSGLNSDSD